MKDFNTLTSLQKYWKFVVVFGVILSVIAGIISNGSSIYGFIVDTYPAFEKNFRPDLFLQKENERIYKQLEQIRTNYRIEAIEEILQRKSIVKNALTSCDEYVITDQEKYLFYGVTDKAGSLAGYHIVSLSEKFQPPIPFFPKKVKINSNSFDEFNKTYRNHKSHLGSRFSQGFYKEFHSQLGGTTNYFFGGIMLNQNYLSSNADYIFFRSDKDNIEDFETTRKLKPNEYFIFDDYYFINKRIDREGCKFEQNEGKYIPDEII
jgi:hypothetical protein